MKVRGAALRSDKDSRNDRASNTGKRSTEAAADDRDMGAALRSIYQRTIDESVPDDLLDLLGKLD